MGKEQENRKLMHAFFVATKNPFKVCITKMSCYKFEVFRWNVYMSKTFFE